MPIDTMLTHENIWAAIDRLAASFGYSASGLAKQAGLDPTSFNKSKRISPEGKPRWPSTESISRILAATGATMSDFMSLLDATDEISSRATLNKANIPLIGFAQAGKNGFFDEDGYPAGDAWDQIQFPDTEMNKENVYAIEVSGDSMMPLYRDGDVLIISPTATIRRGDRVIVRTEKGEVLVKEVIRQSSRKLDLKSLNPDHEDLSFPMKDISWTARILWVSQ